MLRGGYVENAHEVPICWGGVQLKGGLSLNSVDDKKGWRGNLNTVPRRANSIRVVCPLKINFIQKLI